MSDPIPGSHRGSHNPGSYYREMEVLMKEYDLDVPIRIAIADSGSKKGGDQDRL